jgi:uncharacterized protein YecE (DUF72 family)
MPRKGSPPTQDEASQLTLFGATSPAAEVSADDPPEQDARAGESNRIEGSSVVEGRSVIAPPRRSAPRALFADPLETSLAAVHERTRAIAARLPETVRFGTSSWSFPGWAGIVYSRKRTESSLARDGLVEYAQHPLLGTVGVDRGYYAPIPRADFERYASQVPASFRCCIKAPESITAPVHLGHRGAEAGQPNDDFLSVDRFMESMGRDAEEVFAKHVGAFIFEFAPMTPRYRIRPDVFVARLDRFLGELPRTVKYAVEIRERSYLTRSYREVLAKHGVAHTYNYWTAMPRPDEQLDAVPIDNAPFSIVRLLMRPGTRYDDRKNAFAPFDKLVDVDEVMRRGVIQILRASTDRGRPVYVLVNNKAEGSAPLTIEALATLLTTG